MNTRVVAHRFTIGTVLADGVRVYVRRFPWLLLVGVVVLPLSLAGHFLFRIEVVSPIYAQIVVPILIDSLLTIGSFIAEAAVVMVVIHHLRGRPISHRDLLAGLPAFGTVVLGGLLVWLPDLIGRAGYYSLAMLFPDSPWTAAMPYYTGLVVYIAILTFWIMFVPVVVAERAGFHAALSRSAQLGKGQRWRIFALLLILFAGGIAASSGLQLAAYVTLGTMSPWPEDLPSTLMIFGGYELYVMFSCAVSTAIYHHLRLREEGMDSARAVTAFD